MIELSNGHKVDFVAPSGALAFDGRGWWWEWHLRWFGLLDPRLFTIVLKTVLPEKWPGNFRKSRPFDVLKFITMEGEKINPLLTLTMPHLVGGVINALGLTGPGIDGLLKKHHPTVVKFGYKVVISITGPNGGEGCVEMVKKLNGLENVVGIEFNASCPNTDPEFLNDSEKVVRRCREIKEATTLPVWIKLGFSQPYVQIVKQLEGVVEAVSLNTVPWKVIFGDKPSPLAKYGGGGVSGPVAKAYMWTMISELAKKTSVPVIGAGIWNYEDIAKLQSLGVSAWQLGTVFLPYPEKPTKWVKDWRKEKGGNDL